MQWNVLLTPPESGSFNMAMDEALRARAARDLRIYLRVYSWAQPTVSLGRNQPARGLYDTAQIAARGLRIVRRPTGGRAILHHHEITYSVAAPASWASLRESYRRINAVLSYALGALGVQVAPSQARRSARSPSEIPCFEEPAEGELVHGGRKLVGSAQWRDHEALLQHGSILVRDDQTVISELMLSPVAAPPAAATLAGALGREPAPAELAGVLLEAVRRLEDPKAMEWEADRDLARGAVVIEARFKDESWTWRR